MKRWSIDAIRELEDRLRIFRDRSHATTLTEVQRTTHSPYHVLVSCIISLRTKDAVTAKASQRLLALAPNPKALSSLEAETIAEIIYPAGFYRTKGRQLREIGRILSTAHKGAVPPDREELLALPGVGRKTANLVLGLGFGIPAICVDTHVHRIANRLGMTTTRTPEQTERALTALLPQDLWIDINDLLVTFGQNLCHPTSPRCTDCPLADLCPRCGVTNHR